MDIIQSDLNRYGIYDKKGILRGLRNPGFRFLYFFRKLQKSKEKSVVWYFYRMIYKRISIKYGIQIERKTKIGRGFYIGHFGTIVVNGKTEIGKNCNIAHGVTIGETLRGKNKGTPIIGNEVWIGANAIIVGKIKIGNNVLIAPGAFVNLNVPDNSIVIGNPCTIKKNEAATLGYVNNIVL